MKAKIKGDSVVVSGYVNAVERNSVPLRYMRRGNEHTGKKYVERVQAGANEGLRHQRGLHAMTGVRLHRRVEELPVRGGLVWARRHAAARNFDAPGLQDGLSFVFVEPGHR